MIWEIAVLNKMHKTKEFKNIQSKSFVGKEVFYIAIKKKKSQLELIDDDVELSQNEHDLFIKYAVEDLSDNRKTIPFYSKILYFFDAVVSIGEKEVEFDEDAMREIRYWTGFIFNACHRNGTVETTFEDAEAGIKILNQHLALRSWIIGHQLSVVDVILISAMKRNPHIWPRFNDIKFVGFENIKRWYDWVESVCQIFWANIHGDKVNVENINKAIIEQTKQIGSKKLIDAVNKGDLKKAREILEANPLTILSCDNTNSKRGLGIIACTNKDLEMLKLLVEFNIDLEATCKVGRTPLWCSVEQRDIEMTKYLIKKKVNLEYGHNFNRTAMYWCSFYREIDIMKVLIEAGASVNSETIRGKTALSRACDRGYTDIVECLLKTNKIDLYVVDKQGMTALHKAVWGSVRDRLKEDTTVDSNDAPECAQLLLEYGADPNFKDSSGDSPLNLACITFGINWLKILLSFGADINLQNNNGWTPFLSAWYRGNIECCQVLYEYKELDPYVKSNFGYGPLELAISARKDRLVNWVIDEKVNNQKDYPGLEIDSCNPAVLLHHSVHISKWNDGVLTKLLNYFWDKDNEIVSGWIMDVLNRAILKESEDSVKTLIAFYIEKELFNKAKFDEVILESVLHLNNITLMEGIMEHYEGALPQFCLQTLVFLENDTLLDKLLDHFSDKFMSEESYRDIEEVPQEFTKIIENDLLSEYTFKPKVEHPIFNDSEKMTKYLRFNPLQLSVFLNNGKIVETLLEKTCYKASTLLKNGDNIIQLLVKQEHGNTITLQNLLERLELEVGSKEKVKNDFLLTKSESDGLTALEYCAGRNKIFAPLLYKYSAVIGSDENDVFSQSYVTEIEFIHDLTVEEEEKLDKKAVGLEIRENSKIKFKDLVSRVEDLSNKQQWVLDFSKQIGLDLSGKQAP